jgi:hypothetical protein
MRIITSDIVQLFDEKGMEVAYGTVSEMKERLREFPEWIPKVEVYIGPNQKIVSGAAFMGVRG